MEKERSLSSRSSSRHGGWSRHGSSSLPDSDGATSVATMLQPNESTYPCAALAASLIINGASVAIMSRSLLGKSVPE